MSLKAMPEQDQKLVYERGDEVLISYGEKSVVALQSLARNVHLPQQRPSFVISVLNSSTLPADFSTENIQAKANDAPVKVYTYDDIVRQIEKKRKDALTLALLSDIAGTLAASASAYQYHYGNVSGNGPSGAYSGTYSGYTYDPSAAMAAQSAVQERTQANILQINHSAGKSIEAANKNILQRQTVAPETWYGGVVMIAPPAAEKKEGTVTLSVTYNGDRHLFSFKSNMEGAGVD
jgi:hypothetical protein